MGSYLVAVEHTDDFLSCVAFLAPAAGAPVTLDRSDACFAQSVGRACARVRVCFRCDAPPDVEPRRAECVALYGAFKMRPRLEAQRACSQALRRARQIPRDSVAGLA